MHYDSLFNCMNFVFLIFKVIFNLPLYGLKLTWLNWVKDVWKVCFRFVLLSLARWGLCL